MITSLRWLLLACLLLLKPNASAQDTNLLVFLCFGQSNMEGFPGIEDQDRGPVDDRLRVLAAVDFPQQGRTRGNWYPATPPLCRPSSGIGPADYFGRTLASNLPPALKVGLVNVSVAGCKIELFGADTYQAYAATAPGWMKNIITTYMNQIIRALPATIPTAHVVSSQGCAVRPDRLHFTAAGYRELGRRYAEKMLSLLGYKVSGGTYQPSAGRSDQARGHGGL